MKEAGYDFFNCQYKIFSKIYSAIVATRDGLTAAQSALERDVEEKTKSSGEFELERIEPADEKQVKEIIRLSGGIVKEGVIFNSLDAVC